MLRTTKNMKDKYEKIQSCLFDLIPERWEEIYLYASVIDEPDNVQTGDRKFGGGKIGVMHFNPNGKGFDAKREVFFTKRKGIKKDDFFERVMNNQDRAIQDILVEVLRDYGRK